MKRKYYAVCMTIFLSGVIVFCSMAGMNQILKIREMMLMSEKGAAEQINPIRPQQEYDKAENENKKNEDKENTAEKKIENAIISLNDDTGEEIIHNPTEGQISLEQAIKSAKNWVEKMKKDKSEAQEAEQADCFVNAYLSVKKPDNQSENQFEAYNSFWTVNLSNEKTDTVVYINAITGNVWRAESYLYENVPNEIPTASLETFADLTGIEAENKKRSNIAVSSDEKNAVMKLTDKISAVLEFSVENTDRNSVVEHSRTGVLYKCYIVLSYRLVAE